jgi:hypothetical protein
LEEIDITLTQLEEFEERLDLYTGDEGLDGKLDPEIWRAVDARYSTNVFLRTVGETDFHVEGESNLVVIEDLAKKDGANGKFFLFIWEDLGSHRKSDPTSVAEKTWSSLKLLFRR